MASRLVGVHSWCVSGTPIQKNLKDLYGLLVFLHVLPYSHKTWWERLLFWPYIRHGDALPLINLLSQIFWRNAKSDVADEVP
jgi:E3 ubiquitin-protein ligase SHPRH